MVSEKDERYGEDNFMSITRIINMRRKIRQKSV